MTPSQIRHRLAKLSERHLNDDWSWLGRLEELDQPPLFYRLREVEFLRRVAQPDRTCYLVEWAVASLDRVRQAAIAASDSRERPFYVCLSFDDCGPATSGEYPVPIPAVTVSPNPERELLPDFDLQAPNTPACLLIAEAITWLGRSDLLIGEKFNPAVDDQDVYVGYVTGGGVRSLGDHWPAGKARHLRKGTTG